MSKNYAFTNVRAGKADVVDPLQYITRGAVERMPSGKWKAYAVTEWNGTTPWGTTLVGSRFNTRAEAATFVIWYDSHRNCGCEWSDDAGNGRERYQVAA